jgi:ribosomal-protein-alanine N-acetyltransferase
MLNLNFNPFPVLETERFILRNLEASDVQQVFEIRSNPVTMQYVPRPLAKNLDDAMDLIELMRGFTEKNERINWAVTEKGVDKLLGIIGYVNLKQENLRGEVGYILHHEHHRKGIMYEALQAVLNYGFDVVGLHSIEAVIRAENAASRKLVEKAGFVQEAYFKDYTFFNNQFLDQTIYSLIRK